MAAPAPRVPVVLILLAPNRPVPKVPVVIFEASRAARAVLVTDPAGRKTVPPETVRPFEEKIVPPTDRLLDR